MFVYSKQCSIFSLVFSGIVRCMVYSGYLERKSQLESQLESNIQIYHSLYSILDFDWLIHLQITACKYRSAANNWCKYFTEHAHFENASSASIEKYLSFKMSTCLVLPSYQKANCPLYWKKRMQKTPKKATKVTLNIFRGYLQEKGLSEAELLTSKVKVFMQRNFTPTFYGLSVKLT